jgi:hypothetical protein
MDVYFDEDKRPFVWSAPLFRIGDSVKYNLNKDRYIKCFVQWRKINYPITGWNYKLISKDIEHEVINTLPEAHVMGTRIVLTEKRLSGFLF